jgi:hypothetical protein
LHERGVLDRAWHEGETVFRLSDEAMQAQLALDLVAGQSSN